MHAGNIHDGIDQKICLECNRQFTGIVKACPHDGAALVPLARDPMIGTCLMAKYDIIDVIGHGGMGVVYKGRQVLMERTVAIKMLQSQHIADSQSVQRFLREGKATCRMNHPNIITVYDFGITPQSGQPFIVMDYLQGLSLADQIKNDGQVSVERSINILTQATDALDHAHRAGVLHRDLKPSNIMLIDYEGERDYVKIVDFGVAQLIGAGGEQQRLTQMGEVCGSPVYMSPEQCQGLELDARSDIYSMGIVIYETLTGCLPILGKTMVETMSKHISEMPARFKESRPDLYIPERIEAVVFKAMAKDPANRHQTMAELCRDLDTAIPKAGKSQILRTDFPTMPGEEKSTAGGGKKTGIIIAAVAACLLLVAGIAGFTLMGRKETPKTATPVVTPANTATTTPAPNTGTATMTPATTPATNPATTPATSTTASTNPAGTTTSTTAAVPANTETTSTGATSGKPVAPRLTHVDDDVVKPIKRRKIRAAIAASRPAAASSASSSGSSSSSGGNGDRFKSLLKLKSF
ncbi:MAG: protein kinase [Candidatus Obscuribacter sp.]|nr:protein kinase [Candidatus Obscuribacter sp.]